MKIILIKGDSTRHNAFANKAEMLKKINLLKVFLKLGNPLEADLNHNNLDSNKIFKTKDFIENSLKKIHQNIKSDMLKNYLINKKNKDEKVPIIQSTNIL